MTTDKPLLLEFDAERLAECLIAVLASVYSQKKSFAHPGDEVSEQITKIIRDELASWLAEREAVWKEVVDRFATLGDELNQCLQIIVTNAGNIQCFELDHKERDEDLYNAACTIEKAVDRAAKAIRALSKLQALSATEGK